ncbi:MAG: hypothetical protein ABI855_13660 [Bacteroidota bacterium]
MKNKSQSKNSKQIKRRKQNKKNKLIKTNTTFIARFSHLKHFLLQLGMLGRIIVFLFNPQWDSLRTSLPGFEAACDKLKLLVDAIRTKYNAYKKIINHVAVQKKLAKQALAESGYRLMSSCRSYAVRKGLTSLAIAMDVNLSDLLGMKYRDLIALMNNSSALIQPLIPQSGFNITQEIYDDLQSKISDAQGLENGPESAIKQRKSIGSELLVDMKTTMEFFNNELVPLATNFRSNNAFWFNFVNDKRIGKTGSIHTRLLAHCQSEIVNVYGLTVTVDQFTDPDTGKTYEAVSATTDPNGDAEVIEFFAGNRTVTVSGGPNIETTTFPAINFQSGKSISRTFTIRPAFTNIPAPAEKKEKVN